MNDSTQTSFHTRRAPTTPRVPRTAEGLLDRAQARARSGLQRNLRTLGAEAATALDADFARRRPLAILGLAAAAGCAAALAAPFVLRSPERVLRFAKDVVGPAFGARGPSTEHSIVTALRGLWR